MKVIQKTVINVDGIGDFVASELPTFFVSFFGHITCTPYVTSHGKYPLASLKAMRYGLKKAIPIIPIKIFRNISTSLFVAIQQPHLSTWPSKA